MSQFSNPLSHVRVASPCSADWDKMIGDERVRFCGQCELKVYNLSAMTRTQAEDLICGTEGRLCVRFYRRTDGSIITQDCPVGVARLKQRMSRIKRALAAAVFGFLSGAGGMVVVHRAEDLLADSHPGYQVTTGLMAEPPEPITPEPSVGRFVTDPVFQGQAVRRKPRRR